MSSTISDNVRITGLNHVGIPVRSMAASVEWYRDVLGVEPTFVQKADPGVDLDAAVQLDGARLDYAFVDLGNTRIEFLEYQNPRGADFELRNCDVGAVHICFQVDDMDAAYERLVAKGAAVNGPPSLIDSGPLEGWQFCYFRDPDGIQLEVISVAD